VTAEYVPTDAQRSLVESASAFGITQAEIATQLKISEPTLRRTKVSLAGRLTATASIHQFPAKQGSAQEPARKGRCPSGRHDRLRHNPEARA
jgi:hypothetical protein